MEHAKFLNNLFLILILSFESVEKLIKFQAWKKYEAFIDLELIVQY